MTKADHIRQLYDGTRTTVEIAALVGCLPEYVRVVARQRIIGGMSKTDLVYTERLRKYGDRDAAQKVWRSVYRRARKAGASRYDADKLAKRMSGRTFAATARANEARHS